MWYTGITLSAHLIIPHDHHITDTFIDQNENCPASNDKSGHHSGFPLHCHAFNDLTSERSRPLQSSKNIQFSFVTFSILTDASAYRLQSSFTGLFDSSKPFSDSYILKFALLRAPPVLA